MIIAQKMGFRILSSTLRLNKSIIKNIMAPPNDNTIIFSNGKSDSNIHKATILTIKEAKNPAR